MADPININIKKNIPLSTVSKFDKGRVLENLENNILSHWDTWGKFQQSWTNRAYKVFKDLDKYIIMIYLIKNHWQTLADKFKYLSMDEFYEYSEIKIDKINLFVIIKL